MKSTRPRPKRKPRAIRARKSRLLLEYLEGVSKRILEAYPEVLKRAIGGRFGVYALYRRDRLYYVGLASNLMGRIRTHLRDRHRNRWDRFNVYLTRSDRHMRELEALLLRIARPAGNTVSGRLKRATDLQRKVALDMHEEDKLRRAHLLGGLVARRFRRSRTTGGGGSRTLAGLVERSVALRAKHRDREFRATLRADGRIRFQGKLYPSPRMAASTAAGRSMNGWSFWRYRRGREWVQLRQLRK